MSFQESVSSSCLDSPEYYCVEQQHAAFEVHWSLTFSSLPPQVPLNAYNFRSMGPELFRARLRPPAEPAFSCSIRGVYSRVNHAVGAGEVDNYLRYALNILGLKRRVRSMGAARFITMNWRRNRTHQRNEHGLNSRIEY